MNNEIPINSARSQLLLNIFEKIDTSMGLQQVFEIVFSELFLTIDGQTGLIQINSSDKIKSYYGCCRKDGVRFWEPNDVSPCPDFMSEIINNISNVSPELRSKSFFCIPNIVYSEIRDENQSLGYIAIIFNPITDKSLYDQVLDILKAVARQIVIIIKKKEVFEKKEHLQKISLLNSMLSALSHDMKNPLSGISGFVQLIAQKSEDDSIKKYCSIILDSLTQLEGLNSELLKIINGNIVILQKSKVSLPSLFNEVVNNLRELYKHEGVVISIESDDDINVVVDRERIVRVFKHILKNAKEAMPDGGSINVKLYKNDSNARIEISDAGKGIPAHIRKNIYKPFFTYGKENATGLGLTIVKSIIEGHEGSISFSSLLGKDSVFLIQLPLAKKEA